MKLVTAQEMQDVDRQTIDGGHVAALTLMENAGRAVAVAALEELRGVAAPRVEILCGKGNNGGDGLVAARFLAASGVAVRVWMTHVAKELSSDARHNLDRLAQTGVMVQVLAEDIADPGPVTEARQRRDRHQVRGLADPPLEADGSLQSELQRCDLCIDALLGTGVQKRVSPRLAALVDTANHFCKRLLAVDLPSGIDATSAEVHGVAILADTTVTIGLPKRGIVFHPGAQYAGRILVADIGFPSAIVDAIDTPWSYMGHAAARAVVPAISATAHKYARGALLVLAGSRSYPGAAALAAEAGLRTGAGIVHLVVPESIADLMNQQLREVIVHAAPESRDGFLRAEALQVVEELLPRMQAVAVGPGMGDSAEALDCAAQVIDSLRLPHVVDADALQVVGRVDNVVPRVVTPHVGELARMVGKDTTDVLSHRIEVAAQWARQRGDVVLCKGAPTVTTTAAGGRIVNGSGNIGLATAGSGDVLTGIVGSLLAQGVDAEAAASLGAYLHGRSAEIGCRGRAARSLIAGDLLQGIGLALGEITAR